MGLQPGSYTFTVSNKAGKQVGFLLQDAADKEQLALGLIEVGQTATYQVEIDANGFRYRCPINPTPWYDVSVSATLNSAAAALSSLFSSCIGRCPRQRLEITVHLRN